MTQLSNIDLPAPRIRHLRGTQGPGGRCTDILGVLRTSLLAVAVFFVMEQPLKAQNIQDKELASTEGLPSVVVSGPLARMNSISSKSSTTFAFGPQGLGSDCTATSEYESRSLIDQRQRDWNAGKQLAVEIAEEETLVEDPLLTGYLNRLEHRLVSDSGLSGCFVVQLVVDNDVNAYSLPGGFLYLTTGLAMSAQREGELVAALAHETAHVMARHFSRIERRGKVEHNLMLAGGPAGYLIGQSVGKFFVRKSMRDAEFEADRLSLQYQYAAGYDPRESMRLLRDTVHQDPESGSFLSRLFNTHPSIAARLRRLDTVNKSWPTTLTNHASDESDFQAFKALLLSTYARH